MFKCPDCGHGINFNHQGCRMSEDLFEDAWGYICTDPQVCDQCDGKGTDWGDTCLKCGGKGSVCP